jgi:hypothetical protein
VGDNNIVHLFETSKCFLTGNAIVYARENTEVESYGENEGNVFNVKTIKL